jgi:hypothetical protein
MSKSDGINKKYNDALEELKALMEKNRDLSS